MVIPGATSRQPQQTRERFAPADAAARFTGITRRPLLAPARKGIAGAYPPGIGIRKPWVSRISELENAITGRVSR
jgi:hypothetical protein